jgi:hypothetical protein
MSGLVQLLETNSKQKNQGRKAKLNVAKLKAKPDYLTNNCSHQIENGSKRMIVCEHALEW